MKRMFTMAAALAAPLTLAAQTASAAAVYTDRAAFESIFATLSDPTGGINAATTVAEIQALTTDGTNYHRIPGAGTTPAISLLSGMTFSTYHRTFGPQSMGWFDAFNLSDVFEGPFGFAMHDPVGESHAIAFDGGIANFGFSIFDPADGTRCVAGCSASSFTVQAYDMSGAAMGSAVVAPGLGNVGFFGVDGEGALIGSLTITEGPGSYENDYFGDYVTGAAAVSGEVPLPAGAGLLLGGLALLGLRRRG